MPSGTKTLVVLGAGFALVAGLVAYVVLGGREAASPAGAAASPPAPSSDAAPPPTPALPVAATPPAPDERARPAALKPAEPAPAAVAAPRDPPVAGDWTECVVDLPDGEGRIVLMCTPAADKPGTARRQVRIESPAPGQTVVLPPFPADAVVGVYWYPREERLGPFVRLRDPDGEYLLTMRSKSVARLLRVKGETHAGVFVDGEGGYGWSEGPDGKVTATVSGKQTVRLRGRLAESPGQRLGAIERDGAALKFVAGDPAGEESGKDR
jgi:hypothetical protein